jgi:hypothetical protein
MPICVPLLVTSPLKNDHLPFEVFTINEHSYCPQNEAVRQKILYGRKEK